MLSSLSTLEPLPGTVSTSSLSENNFSFASAIISSMFSFFVAINLAKEVCSDASLEPEFCSDDFVIFSILSQFFVTTKPNIKPPAPYMYFLCFLSMIFSRRIIWIEFERRRQGLIDSNGSMDLLNGSTKYKMEVEWRHHRVSSGLTSFCVESASRTVLVINFLIFFQLSATSTPRVKPRIP